MVRAQAPSPCGPFFWEIPEGESPLLSSVPHQLPGEGVQERGEVTPSRETDAQRGTCLRNRLKFNLTVYFKFSQGGNSPYTTLHLPPLLYNPRPRTQRGCIPGQRVAWKPALPFISLPALLFQPAADRPGEDLTQGWPHRAALSGEQGNPLGNHGLAFKPIAAAIRCRNHRTLSPEARRCLPGDGKVRRPQSPLQGLVTGSQN